MVESPVRDERNASKLRLALPPSLHHLLVFESGLSSLTGLGTTRVRQPTHKWVGYFLLPSGLGVRNSIENSQEPENPTLHYSVSGPARPAPEAGFSQ